MGLPVEEIMAEVEEELMNMEEEELENEWPLTPSPPFRCAFSGYLTKFRGAYFTLYLGHLPNDFCVTSPTKLLHFPNNLLRFPNKIASFPQQLESLPQQLVSLPQHIFSFPQQLCVTLPPTKES